MLCDITWVTLTFWARAVRTFDSGTATLYVFENKFSKEWRKCTTVIPFRSEQAATDLRSEELIGMLRGSTSGLSPFSRSPRISYQLPLLSILQIFQIFVTSKGKGEAVT